MSRWSLSNLFKWLSGRSTGFFIAFFIAGVVFHALRRLDATFITFMTAHLGFVVGHSIKEDYFPKGQ